MSADVEQSVVRLVLEAEEPAQRRRRLHPARRDLLCAWRSAGHPRPSSMRTSGPARVIASLLAFHDDREAARASVISVVDAHPEVAEDFGMIEFDEHGHRVGEFVSGGQLKAQTDVALR